MFSALVASQIILGIHFLLLALLCCFGLHRLSMVWRWYQYRHYKPAVPEAFAELPSITVQIPLYNERMVATRIVDAVAAFDYPSDRLQIQIVDDSNDETEQLIADRVAFHRAKGVNIDHVRRDNRRGFKAGALAQAMEFASGEFIAIFDADFVPHASLLRDTVDHFSDSKVGMVQFRWEHLNRKSSWLTKTQAMMLDSHFSLEQHVRSASGLFFNFNGTAGMWRTSAIIDAGHWSADTLTEDLDLSYRAQLRGWKMVYLNDVACAGEIPANMHAFKSQQHRWVKGGIQVMKKMLGTVWRAPISLRQKIEATFHVSNNLAYFVMLIDTLFFLIPSLWARDHYGLERMLWIDIPIIFLASASHIIYLIFGQVALGYSSVKAIANSPRLFILGIQVAVNNARAAAEAIFGHESEFVRTPKSGDTSDGKAITTATLKHASKINSPKADSPRTETQSALGQRLYQAVYPKGVTFEIIFTLIYGLVLTWAIMHGLWFMLPFLTLILIGFASNIFEAFFKRPII